MKAFVALIILTLAILLMIGGIIFLNHQHPAATTTDTTNPLNNIGNSTSLPNGVLEISTVKSDITFTGVLKNVYIKDHSTYATLSITNSGKTFDKDFILLGDNSQKAELRIQSVTTMNPQSNMYKDIAFPGKDLPAQLHAYANHVIAVTISIPSQQDPNYINEALKQVIGNAMSCNILFVENGINSVIRPDGCPPVVISINVYTPVLPKR